MLRFWLRHWLLIFIAFGGGCHSGEVAVIEVDESGSAEPYNYTEIPRRKSTTMNVGKKNTIVNPDDNYGLQKLLERNPFEY